jgi:serine/threonine protein phosphatase PrpC
LFAAETESAFLRNLTVQNLDAIKAEANGRNVNWKAILMERALQHIAKSTHDWTVEQGSKLGLKHKLDSGATITGGYVIGNELVVGNVGDSRTSIVRNNQMVFETVDHSFVELMVSSNQMTREAAENHPNSSAIYRTLGEKPTLSVEHRKPGGKREPFVVAVEELQDGDIVTITCDGVSDALTSNGLSPAAVLQSEEFLPDIAEKMIGKAAGSHDNDTALVFRFTKP